MVWSYNNQDPTDPTGADAMYHGSMRGTTSANLIGGLSGESTPPSSDEQFLDIEVTNVRM